MIFVCFSFLNLGLGFVNCPSGSDMFGICLNRSAISKTGRIFFFFYPDEKKALIDKMSVVKQ